MTVTDPATVVSSDETTAVRPPRSRRNRTAGTGVEPLRRCIRLPYPRPPISANDRDHHQARARKVAQVRRDVGWLLRAEGLTPAGHVTVGLLYVPATVRRRDGGENLTPTLKPCIDALIDVGVVPDDTPNLVTRLMPVIGRVNPTDPATTGVWLTLELR